MTKTRRFGAAVVLLSMVACNASSPTAPTPTTIVAVAPPVAPALPPPPVVAPPPPPAPVVVPFPPADAQFNMTLFRQLVHNAFDMPLYAVRRFSQAPRIYLKTVDEDGKAIDSRTLDETARILETSAGEMTGKFGLAGLERGTGSKIGETGWVTVRWLPQALNPSRICGQANIPAERGTLDLFPYQTNCGCQRWQTAPRIVRHELGHALGFFHTDDGHDLMYGKAWDISQCDLSATPREKFHMAVAYDRPIGSPVP
jgi:hypothetical protein